MHLSKGGLSVGHRSVNGHGVGAEKKTANWGRHVAGDRFPGSAIVHMEEVDEDPRYFNVPTWLFIAQFCKRYV